MKASKPKKIRRFAVPTVRDLVADDAYRCCGCGGDVMTAVVANVVRGNKVLGSIGGVAKASQEPELSMPLFAATNSAAPL